MTYALDAAFRRAVDDDAVKVHRAARRGKHFSAGHDIGTPGRDIDKPFDRVHLMVGPHQQARRRAALRARAGGLPRHVPALARRSPSRRSRWCRAPASPAG
jgi:enoyl-CoA hydratase/carnithine racemase